MSAPSKNYAEGLRMLRSVGDALAEAQQDRSAPDWVERERQVVADEVNRWAISHGWRTITVADVERVEPMAMGHIDYARKLALYACELSWADPS